MATRKTGFRKSVSEEEWEAIRIRRGKYNLSAVMIHNFYKINYDEVVAKIRLWKKQGLDTLTKKHYSLCHLPTE